MSATVGAFEKDGQVYPTICLKDEKDKWMFTIGVSKAKLILRHIEDIREFVNDCEAERLQAKVEP